MDPWPDLISPRLEDLSADLSSDSESNYDFEGFEPEPDFEGFLSPEELPLLQILQDEAAAVAEINSGSQEQQNEDAAAEEAFDI